MESEWLKSKLTKSAWVTVWGKYKGSSKGSIREFQHYLSVSDYCLIIMLDHSTFHTVPGNPLCLQYLLKEWQGQTCIRNVHPQACRVPFSSGAYFLKKMYLYSNVLLTCEKELNLIQEWNQKWTSFKKNTCYTQCQMLSVIQKF